MTTSDHAVYFSKAFKNSRQEAISFNKSDQGHSQYSVCCSTVLVLLISALLLLVKAVRLCYFFSDNLFKS